MAGTRENGFLAAALGTGAGRGSSPPAGLAQVQSFSSGFSRSGSEDGFQEGQVHIWSSQQQSANAFLQHPPNVLSSRLKLSAAQGRPESLPVNRRSKRHHHKVTVAADSRACITSTAKYEQEDALRSTKEVAGESSSSHFPDRSIADPQGSAAHWPDQIAGPARVPGFLDASPPGASVNGQGHTLADSLRTQSSSHSHHSALDLQKLEVKGNAISQLPEDCSETGTQRANQNVSSEGLQPSISQTTSDIQPDGIRGISSSSSGHGDAGAVSSADAVHSGQPDKPATVQLLRRKLRSRKVREGRSTGGVLIVDGMQIGRKTRMHLLFWRFGSWLYSTWFAQAVSGVEHLPLQSGAFLLASNHTSHLDCGSVFMAAWAGGVRKVYALGAKDYFFRNPVKAWFVSNFMNVIPINRRGFSQREVDILREIQESSSAAEPAAVLIFPEGTRSKDGSLQRFKAGVGYLAEKLDIPVVPVCVKGTRLALPKGRTIPHRHHVTVKFGRAMFIRDYLRPEELCRGDSSLPGSLPASGGARVELLPSVATESKSRAAQSPLAAEPVVPASTADLSGAVAQSMPAAAVGANCGTPLQVLAGAVVGNEDGSLYRSAGHHLEGPGGSGSSPPSNPLSEPGAREEKSADAEYARALRKAAQQRFTEDLRSRIADMLGRHGRSSSAPSGRQQMDGAALPLRPRRGRLPLVAHSLRYLLLFAGALCAAAARLGSRLPQTAAGQGYASVSGLLNVVGGAPGARVLLAIAVLFISFKRLWPLLIMAPREEL